MKHVSSREALANKIILFAPFIVTALLFVVAAGLGAFSAVPVGNSTLQDKIDASVVDTELLDELSTEDPELAVDSRVAVLAATENEAEANQVLGDMKLQEVRDAYLKFEQALPGVTVHYATGSQCDTHPACVGTAGQSEILVDKEWALSAPEDEMTYQLARVHADLAVLRVWGTDEAAARELEEIIPECALERDPEVLEAAGIEPVEVLGTLPSVTAMKEIIVGQMTGTHERDEVYPAELQTDIQVAAAMQIARAEAPSVVLPASSAVCAD